MTFFITLNNNLNPEINYIELTNQLKHSMAYETGGSVPHSQRLFNNPYPLLFIPIPLLIPIYSRYVLILSSHLCQGLPKGLFSVGLPVKILKALIPFFILTTFLAHLNILDLIIQSILGKYIGSFSLWNHLHPLFSTLLG